MSPGDRLEAQTAAISTGAFPTILPVRLEETVRVARKYAEAARVPRHFKGLPLGHIGRPPAIRWLLNELQTEPRSNSPLVKPVA